MKKSLLTAVFAVISLCAFAQNTITGTITAGPVFNRPSSATTLSAVGTAVYYTVVPLAVSTPGVIVITCSSSLAPNTATDSYGLLYGPAGFTPATPLVNLLAQDDDSGPASDFSISYNFPAAGTYYIVVTTFYNGVTGTFSLTSGAGGILPVTLRSFTVSKAGTRNLLQWSTQEENNVASFTIERSSNGVDFTNISTPVTPQNHGSAASYSCYDLKPLNAINYYRLKIMSDNGIVKHSSVEEVDNRSTVITGIYPNPASEYLVLQLPVSNVKTSIAIISSSGKIIRTEFFTGAESNVKLPISTLAPGSYYLKVISGSQVSTLPFVKL